MTLLERAIWLRCRKLKKSCARKNLLQFDKNASLADIELVLNDAYSLTVAQARRCHTSTTASTSTPSTTPSV